MSLWMYNTIVYSCLLHGIYTSESDNMDAESTPLIPGLLPRPESLSVKDISQAVTFCMTEENEKQKQKLNLIVHNLPENQSQMKANKEKRTISVKLLRFLKMSCKLHLR